MPMSVFEARAAGLPAVASDVGRLSEIVVEGETGFLVPAGTRGWPLPRAARRRDPDLRLTLGESG